MTSASRLTTALAACLALAACSNSGDSKAEGPAPAATTTSPSPSPIAAAEYDGAQRLVGALNEVGIACINWERTENPTAAEEMGSCYVGAEEVVASIYASREDAAAAPDAKAALLANLGAKSDTIMVVGGNWSFSCDSTELCGAIESRFGGDLAIIPA